MIVLGVVERVGEYPAGDSQGWGRFKDAQPVERLMEGWAEQEVQRLDWVLARLGGD